jgi:hypothetical protein
MHYSQRIEIRPQNQLVFEGREEEYFIALPVEGREGPGGFRLLSGQPILFTSLSRIDYFEPLA